MLPRRPPRPRTHAHRESSDAISGTSPFKERRTPISRTFALTLTVALALALALTSTLSGFGMFFWMLKIVGLVSVLTTIMTAYTWNYFKSPE